MGNCYNILYDGEDSVLTLDLIEEGEIIEQGTHDELTYMRGAYYQLVRNQLELGG